MSNVTASHWEGAAFIRINTALFSAFEEMIEAMLAAAVPDAKVAGKISSSG